MAESGGDLDVRWLMRCHSNKLIFLFKTSDALNLLQCASVLMHVVTGNEAVHSNIGPNTTTTWWTQSLISLLTTVHVFAKSS